MTDEPRTPDDWATLLKQNWEARGRSPSRDYYVASHPGWDDADAWAQHAEVDAELFLHGLGDEWLAPAHVLDVGCGVGRMARPLRARCTSYTGVDIAPAMVQEARRRHADLEDVRFLEGSGLGLPDEVADRRYRLALAVAVFIHCPPDVIASLVRSAYALLEPGGELRFQLRADPHDTEGMQAALAPETRAEFERQVHAMDTRATPEVMSLIEGRYYMGHAFRYAEAGPFLAQATGGEVEVLRFDPAHLYGWVRRV